MSTSSLPQSEFSEEQRDEAQGNSKSGNSFLEQLLSEQQSLTAVEAFSEQHEQGELPAQAKYYSKLLPASPPAQGQQYSFEVDLDKCSGCKACVVACHTLNGLEEEESWRRVGSIVIGEASPQIRHVTTACHHCADPGCLNGCPVNAYDKDAETGIVRHLDDQCIGCKYCTMMCPYEVPTYSERLGIVRKCDMCSQRLAVGEAPACVQSCPNEAIAIRVVPAEQGFASGDVLAPGAPESSITEPTTRYVGVEPRLLDDAAPQDCGFDQPAESHWPLAAMLVGTQASVGLLVLERLYSVGAGLLGNDSLLVTQVALVVAALLALVGLGIAPMHLGQPSRGWKIFLGLKTSWLSREGVVLGKYVGLLFVSMLLFGLPTLAPMIDSTAWSLPSWLPSAIVWTCMLTGVAGLFTSAMIYIVTKRELWTHATTIPIFGYSGLASGSVALASVCTLAGYNSQGLAVLASIMLVGKMAFDWFLMLGPKRADDSELRTRSRKLVAGPLKALRTKRYISGGFAVAMLVLSALVSLPAAVNIAFCGAYLAAVLIGEYSERLLYFSSVVYPRMPGTLS